MDDRFRAAGRGLDVRHGLLIFHDGITQYLQIAGKRFDLAFQGVVFRFQVCDFVRCHGDRKHDHSAQCNRSKKANE